MSVESKNEIQVEIAHVLFIDIVGYTKLSISDQHAAVEELTRIVRASREFQRWRSAARSRNIRVCNFGWESTAGQLVGWSM